jgi:hypothetical protein
MEITSLAMVNGATSQFLNIYRHWLVLVEAIPKLTRQGMRLPSNPVL